jgi:hypothetical protein
MTDRKAALVLAQQHTAGLLNGVWIPPQRGKVPEEHSVNTILSNGFCVTTAETWNPKSEKNTAIHIASIKPIERRAPKCVAQVRCILFHSERLMTKTKSAMHLTYLELPHRTRTYALK